MDSNRGKVIQSHSLSDRRLQSAEGNFPDVCLVKPYKPTMVGSIGIAPRKDDSALDSGLRSSSNLPKDCLSTVAKDKSRRNMSFVISWI
jgi:hypothetical protein